MTPRRATVFWNIMCCVALIAGVATGKYLYDKGFHDGVEAGVIAFSKKLDPSLK